MENDAKISELQALVSLIDDPDLGVFQSIFERISEHGEVALPFLQTAWDNCLDKKVEQRISLLIQKIRKDVVLNELLESCENDCQDLLAAWISLSKLQYPNISENEIRFEFNRIRKSIWLELNSNLTSLEQIKILNHVFFDIHGFAPNLNDADNFDNLYINKILTTHWGNPVSLSAFYMILAQSLELPVYGVNLPGYFVLAYTGKAFNHLSMLMEDHKVLFYINPYGKGQVFSAPEIEKYLSRIQIDPLPTHFNPCTNKEILLRLIESLIASYDLISENNFVDVLKSIRSKIS